MVDDEKDYIVAGVALERKTLDDLSSSVLDGRYEEQKFRLMSNAALKHIGYIIEGPIVEDANDFRLLNASARQCAMVNTNAISGLEVLRTISAEHTVNLIHIMHNQLKRSDPSECSVKYTDFCIDAKKTATTITISEVFQRMVRSSPGIGPEAAQAIIAVLDSEFADQGGATPANLRKLFCNGDAGLNKIGEKAKALGITKKSLSEKPLHGLSSLYSANA